MTLLEDGTLVVKTSERVKKIKRVYYPEQGEEWQEVLSGFAWGCPSGCSQGSVSVLL